MARRLINNNGYSKDLLKVLLGGWGGWKERNLQDPAKYPVETGAGPAATPVPEAIATTQSQQLPTVVVLPADSTATAFAIETGNLPKISVEELDTLLALNNVTLVDVRREELYDMQHIKGAINIPLAEIMGRLSELPKEGNLVVYCQ